MITIAPDDPPANFPTSLDNNTSLYLVEGLVTQVKDEHHNVLKNAIIALETKLGIDSSAVVTTIDYLLKNAASNNPGHTHTGDAIDHTLDGAEHTDVETMTEAEGDVLFWHDDGGFKWRRLPKGSLGEALIVGATSLEWGEVAGPHNLDGTEHSDVTSMIEAEGDLVCYGYGWLEGWARRKSHTITGTTGGAQTNYQVRLKVRRTTGSDSGNEVFLGTDCETDYGDIRFTQDDGRTELDYWFESYSGDTAYFWVEVASIPASPNTIDIYIYYDKSGESTTSDFDATFIFGDPFDNATIDTSRWPSIDGNPTYSINPTSHYLEVTDMDSNEWDGGKGFHSPTTLSLPTEWIIEHAYGAGGTNYTIYIDTGVVAEMQQELMILAHTDWGVSDYGITFTLISDAWSGTQGVSVSAGVGGNVDYTTGQTAPSLPATYDFRMYKLAGTIKIYETSTERVSEANSETPDRFHIGIARYLTNAFGTARFSAFKIRNYASPEPTHTSWGSQETSSSDWSNFPKGTEGTFLRAGTSTLEWASLEDTKIIQRYIMDMQPYDGALWSYTQGMAILIDADAEKIHAEGMVPSGATKFKVKVWAEHVTSSDTTKMQFRIDGKAISETSLTNYYDSTTEWASTSANEAMKKDSGWQTLTTTDERIAVELERIATGGTDPIYIHGIIIEFEVPAYVLNSGEQSLTDFKIPMEMEPYDNAAWSDENGISIRLELANEAVLSHAHLPPNSTQFKVHIWYQHDSATDSTNMTTVIKGQEADTTSTTSYVSDTTAWTSTSANEQKVKSLGWYAVDTDEERIYVNTKYNSGDNIFINAIILEVRTPLKTYFVQATLSSALPADIPASGTGGVSTSVSRADHVHPLVNNITMDLIIENGATWTTSGYGYAIQLNAENERVRGVAMIPAGYTRFKVIHWCDASGITGCDIGLHQWRDDNNTSVLLDISTQTVSYASGFNVEETSWYTIDNAYSYRIGLALQKNGTTQALILGAYVIFDTESS